LRDVRVLQEVQPAIGTPSSKVRYQDIAVNMELDLGEKMPPTRSAAAVLERRHELRAQRHYHVRMPRRRMRTDPEIPLENLCDQVIGHLTKIFVCRRTAQQRRLAHDDDDTIVGKPFAWPADINRKLQIRLKIGPDCPGHFDLDTRDMIGVSLDCR
jgi:hypothetical protein